MPWREKLKHNPEHLHRNRNRGKGRRAGGNTRKSEWEIYVVSGPCVAGEPFPEIYRYRCWRWAASRHEKCPVHRGLGWDWHSSNSGSTHASITVFESNAVAAGEKIRRTQLKKKKPNGSDVTVLVIDGVGFFCILAFFILIIIIIRNNTKQLKMKTVRLDW